MPICPSRGKQPSAPCFTVQDVFREHGTSFERERGAGLSPQQQRVLDDIRQCRTAALGGHLYRCRDCGHKVPVYNSCHNRHCPNCQTLASENWSEQRQAELLPVSYFHNVFTLPHEFNTLALANKSVVYKILFDAVSQILLEFGRKRLRGTLGLILLLHTWDQLMKTHIHIHCLIPGGALSSDRLGWNRPARDRFLFSVEDLSAAYRVRFLELLTEAHEKGRLGFPGSLSNLKVPAAFKAFLEEVSAKDWVVYSKPSFVDPRHAVAYLSRYTCRVAISNSRILDVTETSVTISYIDRKDDGIRKQKVLKPSKFIGRFLQHILPPWFHRIRYYGLFNNRQKHFLLPAALLALGEAPLVQKPDKKTPREWILERHGEDITRCPRCGTGRLELVGPLWPGDAQPKWRFQLCFHKELMAPIRGP